MSAPISAVRCRDNSTGTDLLPFRFMCSWYVSRLHNQNLDRKIVGGNRLVLLSLASGRLSDTHVAISLVCAIGIFLSCIMAIRARETTLRGQRKEFSHTRGAFPFSWENYLVGNLRLRDVASDITMHRANLKLFHKNLFFMI